MKVIRQLRELQRVFHPKWILVLLVGLGVDSPTGSAEAGRDRAAACAVCHGPDGRSAGEAWPHLAGQPVAYLDKQLRDFRSGARSDPTMTGMVAGLDAQAIADLSAWFASQPLPPAPPTPTPEDRGRAVYLDGDRARGLAPCRACHGPDATGGQDPRGNAFPALAGQRAGYTQAQLQRFATGERANDRGAMMQLIASRLNAEEIEAVAAYLSSLGAPEGAP